MKNEYIEKRLVDDTWFDFTYHVPPTELLKIIQGVTFNHADSMGLDHVSMEKESNAFWIITKMKLKLYTPINCQDKITISTWTHEPSQVRFKRDFTIKKGKAFCVKGSSEWCCLDMTTHRPRKAESIKYPNLEMTKTLDIPTNYTNLKLDVDKKDYVYTYVIRSCDIDVNFHTNNLRYNYMALNTFSVKELCDIDIKEYEVYFVNESHEGDNIDIYRKRKGNLYYIEGRNGDKVVFRSVIKYKKKSA